jgi:uncharacterized membrane protein YhaH (DUF805 family)
VFFIVHWTLNKEIIMSVVKSVITNPSILLAWQHFCGALKKYATFNGRTQRPEFWCFFLFYMVFYMLASILGGILGTGIITGIYSLALLAPLLAAGWRRMHDVNKPGVFSLIPIYNLILWAGTGHTGSNQFGGDPKESYTERR